MPPKPRRRADGAAGNPNSELLRSAVAAIRPARLQSARTSVETPPWDDLLRGGILYVRNAEPGTHSPPAWLQWAGHGLYAYAFLLGLRAALIFVGSSAPPGGNAFDGILALPAIGLGFAALLIRRLPRGATWIATHVLWITVTFCVIAMTMALTGIVLVIAVLFAGPFPPLARLILVPWISVPLAALWYAWRILRGYFLYLHRRPTSAAVHPAFMTTHPSRQARHSLNT